MKNNNSFKVTEKLLTRVDLLANKLVGKIEKQFNREKNAEKKDVLFDVLDTVKREVDLIKDALESIFYGEKVRVPVFNRLNSIYCRESNELMRIYERISEYSQN